MNRPHFKIYKGGFIQILGNGKVKYFDLELAKEFHDLYHSVIDRECFGNIDGCPCISDCKIEGLCNYQRIFKTIKK